jgi:amidase
MVDTGTDINEAYVGRIIEVNKTLHMVVEINPDAWSIAKELDDERASGKSRGFDTPNLVYMALSS